MSDVPVITSNQALLEFTEICAKAPLLAIDTEFFRRHSYYAQLCLIQVNHGTGMAVIDVLADGLDLAPFWQMLNEGNNVKIFHSASQDLEIMYHINGCLPQNLYDTQIACMACMGESQLSYEKIVNQLIGISLDKTLQSCDWRVRPLTDKQLEYAIGDVKYLLPIYTELVDKIADLGREDWIAEEMAKLTDTASYEKDYPNLWRQIRGRKLALKGLSILQTLAHKRELLAIRYNVPRKHIISDESLLEISKHPPKSLKVFLNKNHMNMRHLTEQDKEEFFTVIGTIVENPALVEATPPKPNNQQQLQIDTLRLLRKLIAHQLNIASKLLCEQDMLDEMIMQNSVPDRLIQGWRYEYFGKILQQFLQGKSGLQMVDGRLRISEIK